MRGKLAVAIALCMVVFALLAVDVDRDYKRQIANLQQQLNTCQTRR